jgi:hypothetical protein
VVCNATSMPSHDFFDSIKDAVQAAIIDSMLDVDIDAAIKEGVALAMRENK